MKRSLLVLFLVMSLGLAACSPLHQPSLEELKTMTQADWSYPTDYQLAIKNYWHGILFDPTSPIYEFSEPQKGYYASGLMREKRFTPGWIVNYKINAKNRMGGYVGWERHQAFIVNNKVEIDSAGPIGNVNPLE